MGAKKRAPAKKKAVAKKPVAKKPPPAPRKPARMTPAPRVVTPPSPPSPPPPPPVDHLAVIGGLWSRLEAYVASIGAPPLSLAPGASEKAIRAAEKEMGLAFPPDVRASLRLHDGQTATGFPWMPGCPPLWPVARIVDEWRAVQKLAAKVKPSKTPVDPAAKVHPVLHRAGRIPIAEGTFLDLDPGPTGRAGQLVTTVNRKDLVVIDHGFAAALERWVGALERGIWVHDAGKQTVLPRAAPLFQGNPAGLFSRR